MTKANITKWGILCAVVLFTAAAILLWPSGRTYTLNLPEPESLDSIILTRGSDSASVSDMGKLLELLTGTERKTKSESIQDFPVNGENVLKIDFYFKEQGVSTAFVYQKRGAFFIEQPYNGVYGLTQEEFREIEKMMAA